MRLRGLGFRGLGFKDFGLQGLGVGEGFRGVVGIVVLGVWALESGCRFWGRGFGVSVQVLVITS